MTDLRITVRNTSDTGGTFLTPVWFGFHDGSFDLFDLGAAASPGLEEIAEDGNAAGLGAELTAADGDALGGLVFGANGPITTTEIASTTVTVDGASNGYFAYAAMLLPSNDAFIGNADAVKLFNAKGRFLGETTITDGGADVFDAGTEVNTELDAAFINQTAPNTGVDENGVVTRHPGFNGSDGNPVGEGDQIILGGVNAFGETIDPVEADFTLPDAEVAEIHINTVTTRTGGDGIDLIFGNGSDDIVTAGGGTDIVLGRGGWDVIDAGAGGDIVRAGRGVDIVDGGAGADTISGNRGDDVLDGGTGGDFIFGGKGDDLLMGGEGGDNLFGNRDDDTLSGGAGNDFLRGGSGDDTFLFATGDDADTILDFGRGDDALVIDVDGIDDLTALKAAATETASGVVLEFGSDSLFLLNADLEVLDTAEILFV